MPPEEAGANAVVAVALARIAVAEAIVAVCRARGADVAGAGSGENRIAVLRGAPLSGRRQRIVDEVRHLVADKPRADPDAAADHPGHQPVAGDRLPRQRVVELRRRRADSPSTCSRRSSAASCAPTPCVSRRSGSATRCPAVNGCGEILVAKNLAMAVLITVAGLPVIGFLTVASEGNPVALVDQLVTMVFIWLGVGNVLSVLYPLRHEPFRHACTTARGSRTCSRSRCPTASASRVNLMIFWRLWSRQTAATELPVASGRHSCWCCASALASWVLLTVFAVACSREPRIRRMLSREMVAYRPVRQP